MKKIRPLPKVDPNPNQGTPQISCYFIVSALAIYDKDEAIKQRSLNVLVETEHANITKQGLADIQTKVMQRLQAENNVSPDQLRDIVIQNISMLGMMSAEQFHGAKVAPLDGEMQGTA